DVALDHALAEVDRPADVAGPPLVILAGVDQVEPLAPCHPFGDHLDRGLADRAPRFVDELEESGRVLHGGERSALAPRRNAEHASPVSAAGSCTPADLRRAG